MKKYPTNCSHLEADSVNTLRLLSLDQVYRAKSGHFGFPLGAAAIIHTIFSRHLSFDPFHPEWANRDRFVLSAGHGSAMLYAQLHLAKYDVSLDDLKSFRKLGSKTPGHPERGVTPGVEVTTGPLGQGVANGVGLAVAERYLRATLPSGSIDHYVYVLASDGDLMEGISYEAASLAGIWGLDRLIVFYDDNDVVIDSHASEVLSSDAICASWQAVGWNVVTVEDGMDIASIDAAIKEAKSQSSKPTLIRVKSLIGAGSPLAGTSACHGGSPSSDIYDETRASIGVASENGFFVPEEVSQFWDEVVASNKAKRERWLSVISTEVLRMFENGCWQGWGNVCEELSSIQIPDKPMATRRTSEAVLAYLAEKTPMLIGGSADLEEATGVRRGSAGVFGKDHPSGANLRFGVREHAMGAIVNGIAAHSILLPFGSTFMMFASYQMNAIRMASLQGLPSLFIFSHDSVLIGEDGPTHQPIEILPALRAIPGLRVLRPADMRETINAWREIILDPKPTALILSRPDLPQLPKQQTFWPNEGAYVVHSDPEPKVALFASGSEVGISLEAANHCGIAATVVSVPDVSALEDWTPADWQSVAPTNIPRIVVEAANPMSWYRVLRPGDETVAIETFGASAPPDVLAKEFGFTSENVCKVMKRLIHQD
uniref:transketolase family protein n=1 Tax=Vaginimicrobium propionicum TaxID=1871034 RepID=UPI000970F364|nr:transketolase [Vaginimicrobium propionicum]